MSSRNLTRRWRGRRPRLIASVACSQQRRLQLRRRSDTLFKIRRKRLLSLAGRVAAGAAAAQVAVEEAVEVSVSRWYARCYRSG